MDQIEQALRYAIGAHQGQGVWVLDENLSSTGLLSPIPGLTLICNRFDLQNNARLLGWPFEFSDFEFGTRRALDVIYYRVSKEKPVVHHVINQALARLRPGGRLLLAGAKNEGFKTYFDKARQLFGQGSLQKLGKGAFLGELVLDTETDARLDDRDYASPRIIAEDGPLQVYSKPGLFGWEKVDQGSALLVAQLEQTMQRFGIASPRVLDIGCGYGYLSLHAWRLGASEVIATDNNAAAVAMCGQNFSANAITGRVVPADCAAEIEGLFDLVICNPPFHQGFSVEGGMTERFVAAAAAHLPRNGQALFVVNRFIGLERSAQQYFATLETLAEDGQFRVVRLAAPKRR